jgi:phosphoribosylformylglycinamidine synthase
MSAACLKFGTPVTGGNVSFYNQTMIDKKTEPVYPTPTIGMIGIVEDKKNIMTMSFKNKGHMIFILGKSFNDISSSQYLVSYHHIDSSPAPVFDLDFEFKLHEIVKELIRRKYIVSAHDISEGGLFTALVESSMENSLGFDITTDAEIRPDAFLFGESQGRVIVSVTEQKETEFIDYMMEKKFPFSTLGHVTKGQLRIDDESYGFIEDARKIYDSALEEFLNK